jgi:hypothetical protein
MILNHNPSVSVPVPIEPYFESQMHKDGDLETKPMLRLKFILSMEGIVFSIVNNLQIWFVVKFSKHILNMLSCHFAPKL